MTRCQKCNRQLKAPSPSGYGPVCALAIFGTKPKPLAHKVERDARTGDLFAEVRG